MASLLLPKQLGGAGLRREGLAYQYSDSLAANINWRFSCGLASMRRRQLSHTAPVHVGEGAADSAADAAFGRLGPRRVQVDTIHIAALLPWLERPSGAAVLCASMGGAGVCVQSLERRKMKRLREGIRGLLTNIQDALRLHYKTAATGPSTGLGARCDAGAYPAESVGGAGIRIETVIPHEHGGLFDFGRRLAIEGAGERAARAALDGVTPDTLRSASRRNERRSSDQRQNAA